MRNEIPRTRVPKFQDLARAPGSNKGKQNVVFVKQ